MEQYNVKIGSIGGPEPMMDAVEKLFANMGLHEIEITKEQF